MNEIKYYTIDSQTLEDLMVFPKISRSEWQKQIYHTWADIREDFIFEDPILDKFKHFMCYPAGLFFYIEENIVKKCALTARNYRFDKNLDIIVDRDKDVLLYLKKIPGSEDLLIRYVKGEKILL